MRCCVPDCKNDSRHISKSEGITFHVFPLEKSLRESWLRAVGKDAWEPRERSAVCSNHFLPEDLYETKSGLRRVRTGAVPIGNVTESMDLDDPVVVGVCRICLETEAGLYPLKEGQLDQIYEQLTGLSLEAAPALPLLLCALCTRRLRNHARLRACALAAHRLLGDALRRGDPLTARGIQSAKGNTSLITPLTTHHNHQRFDLDIVYDGNDPDKPPLIHEVNVDIQIKNEEGKFFEELETENPLPLKEENNENQENVDVEDNDNDADFVASGNASDSSCDIPINQLKKDKQKKKTKISKKAKEKVPKVKKKAVKKDPNEPKIDRRRKPFLNEDLNETLFTITNLTIEEQLAEIDKRQESSNYKNAVYKCTVCFKGFLEEEAYDSHMVRHTNQCGEFACKICKTHFKHPHALRKHNTAHHTQRFSCNRCTYITTHRQTARLHERWHKGTKYQCPHCQDEFIKFTTYMGHIRIKHPSDFVCQLCGYSFVSEKGIELHKKLKHRLDERQVDEDSPHCEMCNLRFVSDEALRRHRLVSARHSSTEQKPKQANKAKTPRKRTDAAPKESKEAADKAAGDERRAYPSQMRRAEGPIPCEQCGLQLEDSRAYHGHFRRMHPDKNRTNYPSMKSPCMCDVCGRMFQSYALLKDHTWVHTGEKPFKCELCSKSFRMKQRLVAHRRVHSQQRATYVCGVCGKHFSTHSNRQRHMFIHTGLKPFKCEMCGKCFKHASEKRAHITYVHLKKPWPKRARHKRHRDPYEDSRDPPEGPRDLDGPPMWPCDPKMPECAMVDDGSKPMYYNLKI